MFSNGYTFKICVLGDGGVGKSTLVHRYTTGFFKEDIKLTMGVSLHSKIIDIDGIKVMLQLWDFGGEERFKILAPHYFDSAIGGFFMFDITRYTSLSNAREWLNVLKLDLGKMKNDVILLLIGGKLDLNDKREVSRKQAEEVARELHFHEYIECSSKTGENVNDVFECLVRAILKKVIQVSP